MKPAQLPLAKLIVGQMITAIRENTGKTNADYIPVIQRASSGSGNVRCVQLVTTTGLITFVDDGKLTELDYPAMDIGGPDNWSKVSKGLIASKTSEELPFERAANVAAFADPEVDVAVSLIKSAKGLPPVHVLAHPGCSLVFSRDAGKSLIWAHNPAAQQGDKTNWYQRLIAEWTTNPLECPHDMYGVIRPWHRGVAYSFPKDPDTGQPDKLDGVAFAPISTHAGIRLVSRELGLVVSMACSRLPESLSNVSYLDENGNLVNCTCADNYIYSIKEDKSMEVKMIDIGQVRKPTTAKTAEAPSASTVTVPEAVKPSVNPAASKPAVSTAPTMEDSQGGAVIASTNEIPKQDTPATTPSDPPPVPKSAEELLTEALNMCSEVQAILKPIVAAVKSALKQHRAELKEAKSAVKDSEELVKLRAAHKRLKALLLDSDV